MATNTFDTFTAAAKGKNLYDEFDPDDLRIAQEDPDAGMGLLQAKEDYRNAATDDQRAMAHADAERIRSGHQTAAGGTGTAGTQTGSTGTAGAVTGGTGTAGAVTGGTGTTYEGFVQAAINAGMYDQFDPEDLALAKYAPEAGMQILQAKIDYNGAATDDQRILANETANAVRYKYGQNGGNDGGTFSTVDTTKYAIPDLTQQMLNYGAFSYNADTDPNYQAARKEYLREADRTTEDVLAKDAAVTGGLPTSSAVTAASQAGDYYKTQLNDKYNTYYKQAYQEYMDKYDRIAQNLSTVRDEEKTSYTRTQEEDETAYERAQTEAQTSAAAAKTDKETAQDQVDAILKTGGMPSDELLSASGYSREYAEALASYYAAQLGTSVSSSGSGSGSSSGGSSGGGSSGGGSGYDNGSLTEAQVEKLQNYYGTTADGMWGPNSTAAAGGLTADEAWASYTAGSGEGGGTTYDYMQANGDMLTSRTTKYAEVTAQVESMKASGATKQEVAGYIADCVDKAWISEKEAADLANSYGIEL